MIPSAAFLRSAKACGAKWLDSGCYADVFEQEDGTVVRLTKHRVLRRCPKYDHSHDNGQDADMGWWYHQFCHDRLQGVLARGEDIHSPAMKHLPEVLHVGKIDGRGWSVMPHYTREGALMNDSADETLAWLKDKFQAEYTDAHRGNRMWCEKRDQLILTDPIAYTVQNRRPSNLDVGYTRPPPVRALYKRPHLAVYAR